MPDCTPLLVLLLLATPGAWAIARRFHHAQRGQDGGDLGEQVWRPVEVDLEPAVAQGHVYQPGQRFGGGGWERREMVEHQPSRSVATTAAAAPVGLSPARAMHSRT